MIHVSNDVSFDPTNFFHGPPVYVRRQVQYVGHATTTYSIEQTIAILDYIGIKNDSDDCLPFAVSIVENGQLVSIAEDNGEMFAGDLLASCIKKIEGFNIMVCVSRKVKGFYVTDMVQSQKHRAIKEAALKALDLLYASLTAPAVPEIDIPESEDSLINDARQIAKSAMPLPAIPLKGNSSKKESVRNSGKSKPLW